MLVSIGQLGVACGPLLGGALTQYTTWRWCELLRIPIFPVLSLRNGHKNFSVAR